VHEFESDPEGLTNFVGVRPAFVPSSALPGAGAGVGGVGVGGVGVGVGSVLVVTRSRGGVELSREPKARLLVLSRSSTSVVVLDAFRLDGGMATSNQPLGVVERDAITADRAG
jgi:hypothetical protein